VFGRCNDALRHCKKIEIIFHLAFIKLDARASDAAVTGNL
jgi:hypothetical protein